MYNECPNSSFSCVKDSKRHTTFLSWHLFNTKSYILFYQTNHSFWKDDETLVSHL